jgi:alpha-beta hydrolase superfamily lysophospholipase
MPKEFLLVHGACHGAWCWEEVAGRLRARGHRVAAVDLPGHGRRAAEVRRASVASAQCAARLGVTPVDVDSAHNPMLSRPDELCRILERVDS